MVAVPKSAINPDEYSRCEERRRVVSHGSNINILPKSDTALRESIYEAIWKDSVLRAIEYDETDVRTHAGIVHIPVGKVSFGFDRLLENIRVGLEVILRAKPPTSKGIYLRSIALSTTMGPGIKIDPLDVRNALK